MTDIIDRYRSYTYPTEDDAHAAAEVLEQFGLKPVGPLLLRDVSVRGGGESQSWEIACVIPEKSAQRDPLDLDETVDYIDSHWDREADDRDINSRRRTRDEY